MTVICQNLRFVYKRLYSYIKAMFIFTFISTFLLLCCKIYHSNDDYNVFASDWEQILSISLQTNQNLNFDIKYWMKLEHSAFVEIRERFYALFIEIHDSSSVTEMVDNFYVTELFLVFCGCFIHFGDLSEAVITKLRKSNCAFTEVMVCDNINTRARQRFCNIYSLPTEIHICNYPLNMANQLFCRTEGFPTCLQSPLPLSLYTVCYVYEIARCSTGTMKGVYCVKCITNCHQRQLSCEDVELWSFRLIVVTSSWSQWSYSICYSNHGEERLVVVTSCYNQVICSIKPKKCFFIFLSTSGTMIIDNRQEIDEVCNDYEVSCKDLINVGSLRRRLLQTIDYECYRNMDYNTQRGKSNYRRHVRYLAPAVREDKGENESEDEDEDKDDDDYEVTDEKADNNSEQDEQENENEEEEEDNEFGHLNHGQWIRMERSNHIGLRHASKKQNKYLTKETVRIRSVSKECNEEPTEELQYYDYETSGINAPFGNMHTLQIGYIVRLTTMCLLFTFII